MTRRQQMTAQQVAERLGTGRRHVAKLRASGQLRGWREPDAAPRDPYFYDRAEVEAFARQRERGGGGSREAVVPADPQALLARITRLKKRREEIEQELPRLEERLIEAIRGGAA